MILSIIKSRGFFESSLTIFGNFIAVGISAVALIIISRYMGPEKFGAFSVGFAIVLIITKIVDFGTNNIILKFALIDESEAFKNTIFSLVLKFRLSISLLLIVLGLFFSPILAKILNFQDVGIIYLSFTVGLATSYYEYLLTILQSFHKFLEAVIANILQSITKLLISLLLAFGLQLPVPLIFAGYILAPLAPFFALRFLLPTEVSFISQHSEIPIKKMIKFARHSAVSLIAAGIIENVDILFVKGNLNLYETGLYSGAVRIAMVFSMVAYSLASVLNPRVARYKTKEHLSSYLNKSFLVMLFSLVGFIFFIPLAPALVHLTIGPDYLSGTPYLIILAAASFLAIATVPFLALFYSFEADWYFSISGVMQLLVVIVGNVWLVPEYGLSGAAWTRFAARLTLFFFTFFLAILLYRKNYVQIQNNS